MRRIDLPSGLWAGHYAQRGASYPQRMTLEFADGLVRGDGIDGIGAFFLEGEYRVDAGDLRVGWIKTYEGAHSVLYLGRLEDGHIVGEWSLPGACDRFALRPHREGETKMDGRHTR
jgi:hypothetical protein